MLYIALTIIVILVALKIYSRLSLGRCISSSCLVGKTALVTGGNSGLGYETALGLAARGCRVIIADKDNCDQTKKKIIEHSGNPNIVTKYFDLSSLSSVRKLAKDIIDTEERLDILINNAGASTLGNSYTEDGIHIGMQVNHFAAFLLTHLLIGLLRKSAPSRIIFVGSIGAHTIIPPTKQLIFSKDAPVSNLTECLVYANSKLCTVIVANEFAKKLRGTGVTVNSLHPGVVDTPIVQKFFDGLSKGQKWQATLLYNLYRLTLRNFIKSAEEGAQTALYLAMSKEVEDVTGKYFIDCRFASMPYCANDVSYSRVVWEISERLVKLTPHERYI